MPISRIYQSIPLAPHTELRLDEKASHHLARVLRANLGDSVTLFNGQQGEYPAVITAIDKKGVTVKVADFSSREAESPLTIHLAQGIARGEKMDFIIQKAVELGVNLIIPLSTERSTVKLDRDRESKRLRHWESVVESACEQSGRNRLPEIIAPCRLVDWLPQVSTGARYVLSPHVQVKLTMNPQPDLRSVTLLVGPEGGLSEAEIDLASQQGFTPLNLGPRVLRTETATIAAMTVMQSLFGDILTQD